MKKPGLSGGLALLWKEGVDVKVINGSDNYILAKVVEKDGSEWFLTSFYGWLEASQKPNSLALLNHIKSFVYGPGVCVRDFNVILNSIEYFPWSTHG